MVACNYGDVVIAKLSVIISFLKYNNQIRGSVGMMAGAFNIGLFAYPFGWLLPIGVAIIPYAIQFKYNTLPLIAMISNLTIIISIAILYLFQMMIL
ncbi:hypothetical protein KFV08_01305 [Macrococcoides canis]|nr:hypothetical protein [Macrococcus canis]UTH09450.1 hypothetical protein KFV08_01305 [Macrococcus canis]